MKQTEKRQIRVQALQILYQMEFQNQTICKKQYKTTALHLAQSVHDKKEQIDPILSQHSQNWSISRMALLDLSILRLAIYEILFKIPKESPKIFINEAIELAKVYGSSDSFTFVNGILDSLLKDQTVSHSHASCSQKSEDQSKK